MSILTELDTPIFAAEGVPENTDPATWKVEIQGMDKGPVELTLNDFHNLPYSKIDARLTSVSGWSVRAEWEGVLWRDFIKVYPPGPEATLAIFESPGGYTTNVPLEDLDQPRALWAWRVAGEPLEADYGGPLRMVIPNLWGYKSCKWVVKLTFTNQDRPGFWETRGYTNSGEIEPGTTLDVNSSRRRPINGGEVTEW